MKNGTRNVAAEYEKPQVATILLQIEQGFAGSNSNSMLDDMKETEGEWANY